jgi:hypothetical protein
MKRKKKILPTPPSAQELQDAQLTAFQPLLSPQEFEALKLEVEKTLPPSIRINPLKTGQGFVKDLKNAITGKLSRSPFAYKGFVYASVKARLSAPPSNTRPGSITSRRRLPCCRWNYLT